MTATTTTINLDVSTILRGLGGLILLVGGVIEFIRGGDPVIAGSLAGGGAATLGVNYYHP